MKRILFYTVFAAILLTTVTVTSCVSQQRADERALIPASLKRGLERGDFLFVFAHGNERYFVSVTPEIVEANLQTLLSDAVPIRYAITDFGYTVTPTRRGWTVEITFQNVNNREETWVFAIREDTRNATFNGIRGTIFTD